MILPSFFCPPAGMFSIGKMSFTPHTPYRMLIRLQRYFASCCFHFQNAVGLPQISGHLKHISDPSFILFNLFTVFIYLSVWTSKIGRYKSCCFYSILLKVTTMLSYEYHLRKFSVQVQQLHFSMFAHLSLDYDFSKQNQTFDNVNVNFLRGYLHSIFQAQHKPFWHSCRNKRSFVFFLHPSFGCNINRGVFVNVNVSKDCFCIGSEKCWICFAESKKCKKSNA